MVRFLGLQKGTEPEEEDVNGEFHKNLKQLQNEIPFQAFDSCYWRNAIFTLKGTHKIKKLSSIGAVGRRFDTEKPAAETPPRHH
jgi:hypothetical protein